MKFNYFKITPVVFGVVSLLFTPAAYTADKSADKKAVSDSGLDPTVVKIIKGRVKKELNTEAVSIKKTPIRGLYEVTVPPRVFYISADGRYVLAGDLIDLQKGVNLTEQQRDKARVASIENVGEVNMVVFAPEKVKHTITVFTDIDCGYCRKLHNEMASYNKLGIKVRYLAYPRAGVGSESYKKAVSVWCADDKRQAMTDAKNGKDVPEKNCENPVASQMALGRNLGVNGTPAIVLANGQLYPGYAPADRLIKVLEQVKHPSVEK